MKTCFAMEGDAACRQLQAASLTTKRRLGGGDGDTAISLRYDIFILRDIMFYWRRTPPRETDGRRGGGCTGEMRRGEVVLRERNVEERQNPFFLFQKSFVI